MNIALSICGLPLQTTLSLPAAQNHLSPHGFHLTPTAAHLIYHGELQPEFAKTAVAHLYFSPKTQLLQSAVVHIFPLDFERTQRYLEALYGRPEMRPSQCDAIWHFTDGKLEHRVMDRFGEEEGIYLSFLV